MYELSTGCTIETLNAGNPTLADDLVLTSPTKQDLETALCIANEYSNIWRFTHNTDKCKVVVFSKTRSPTNVSVKGQGSRRGKIGPITKINEIWLYCMCMSSVTENDSF